MKHGQILQVGLANQVACIELHVPVVLAQVEELAATSMGHTCLDGVGICLRVRSRQS